MPASVRKAALVLDLFSVERPDWGPTEVADELGIAKSTAHALLAELAGVGLIERLPCGRTGSDGERCILRGRCWRRAGTARWSGTADTDGALSPVPLMQLATGFWAFKTLAAAHEIDLFSRLSGTAGMTAGVLAEALAIEERPAEMLLTGCAALGLLEKDDGRYINSPLAEEFLVRGKPYYFGGFVQMLDQRLYPGWGRLTEAIRTNRPTTWDPDRQSSLFDGEDPELLRCSGRRCTRCRRSPPGRWVRPST